MTTTETHPSTNAVSAATAQANALTTSSAAKRVSDAVHWRRGGVCPRCIADRDTTSSRVTAADPRTANANSHHTDRKEPPMSPHLYRRLMREKLARLRRQEVSR